ncbi:MAG: ATPase, T2SS/T4P/T4SS family [Elusimicrobiota bacterium]
MSNQGKPVDVDQMIAELDFLLGAGEAPAAVAERPIIEEEPAPTFEAAEPEPASSGVIVKKVLIVDDSNDYRGVVRYLLEQTGYMVVEAVDGAEGLAKAIEEKPDLILLDFNMPFMNGYELLQELRATFELRKTPIIMFTGAPNRKQLMQLGMDISAFLEKPVTNAQLLEAVAAAIKDSPGRVAGAKPQAQTAPAEEMRGLDMESDVDADDSVVMESEAAPQSPAAPENAPMMDLEALGAHLEEKEEMVEVDVEPEKKEEEESGLEVLANDSPLIKKVNRILVQAVTLGASDIHIEPQEKSITVRLRLNGSLKPLCQIPAAMGSRLSARIKIMSNLVITERRRPQDGQFRVTIKGKKIEFRVSTIPGTHGEKIVMRVLGSSKVSSDPAAMGMSDRDLACVERAISSPHGLILVTGPTGSGKTTTLYTMISLLNKPDVNIMTAEDPVEYQLPGINQVHVKPAIGLTFEAVLRSFLRQDPDIMLVGEVRDLETAEIAVKASITGHLVLSTLHTNSAPATITRLTHMGLAPFLVSASVRLIIAQRLIKKLCSACKIEVAVSDEDKACLTEDEVARLGQVYRSVGCRACNQTGYAGRKPIFEVMPIRTPEMRQAILGSSSEDYLAELAVKEGMTSLRHAAITAVSQGETSLSEALKIIMAE